MADVDTQLLKAAVVSEHGGPATYVESVAVKETVDGTTVWDGMVAVFDLNGMAHATRAYAWSSSAEESGKRRFITVLHLGGVRGPEDAVRAALEAEQRAKSARR